MSERAARMIQALGGKDNIVSLDSCITRLRLTLRDPGLVDEKKLRALGAVGVIKVGGSVQVILGTTAELVEAEMKLLLKTTEQ